MAFKNIKEIALKATENVPSYFRCHEVARKIASELNRKGITAEVKDGIAVYENASLIRDFFDYLGLLDSLTEEQRQEILGDGKKKESRVFHSWCESPQEDGLVVVVDDDDDDWHAHLRLSKGESVDNLLIVEKKQILPHSYFPVAINRGKWIIFRTFPPIFTKLRV
ncbi:MAG: hypothetical protein WC302_03155 [Candidatus Paceibacterota bacterium]|jgi:hypothetical protein